MVIQHEESAINIRHVLYGVRFLLTQPALASVVGLTIDQIKEVYPLVVTLDGIGGTMEISAYLNVPFSEQLRLDDALKRKVGALRCVDCEGMEHISRYFRRLPLPQLMRLWHRVDNKGFVPFVAVPFPGPPEPTIGWLAKQHDEVFKSILKVLFPDKDPEAALEEVGAIASRL
jgi:hypothetical protein